MSKKKVNSPKENDWMGFYQELFSEKSDRAMVLVGAAFLDVRLEKILDRFLVDDGDIYSEVLNPKNGQAIIGSFGSRITICYALGLISRDEKSDLRIIKNIRNEFAHGLHDLSFDNQGIINLTDNLLIPDKIGNDKYTENPRGKFLVSVALLAQGLELRALSSERERRTEKPEREIITISSITITRKGEVITR